MVYFDMFIELFITNFNFLTKFYLVLHSKVVKKNAAVPVALLEQLV